MSAALECDYLPLTEREFLPAQWEDVPAGAYTGCRVKAEGLDETFTFAVKGDQETRLDIDTMFPR